MGGCVCLSGRGCVCSQPISSFQTDRQTSTHESDHGEGEGGRSDDFPAKHEHESGWQVGEQSVQRRKTQTDGQTYIDLDSFATPPAQQSEESVSDL